MAVKQHVNESEHVPSDSEQSSPTPELTFPRIIELIEQYENNELYEGLTTLKFCEIIVIYLGSVFFSLTNSIFLVVLI